MGEGLVSIPMSEYRKLRDLNTRVKVMLDHLAHYGSIYAEDIYLIMDMPEDAQMCKEEREGILQKMDKGIEVIGA